MTLQQLNQLDPLQRSQELTRCCGSTAWVERMEQIFPVPDKETLLEQAKQTWNACSRQDWLEAFTHHPKIGDISQLKEKFAATSQWAGEEQASVRQSATAVLRALKEENDFYEKKFGYIFIVCASGKPAEEMLLLLQARLLNTPEDELLVAMREQNNITLLRLQKLLTP